MKHAKKVIKKGFKYVPATAHITSDHLRQVFQRERERIEAEQKRREQEQQAHSVTPFKTRSK